MTTSLADRTILITGATDGLGRGLAHDLARRGAQLILHGRRPDALAELADELRGAGVTVHTVLADFAELDDVRKAADDLIGRQLAIDVLINNAGIGAGAPAPVTRATTTAGHELRFAVNYLAPALLTARLLPVLRTRPGARIVNVASAGQQALDFTDPMLTLGYSGMRAYCQSKLALIMFGFDLAERFPADQLTVNSLHPGSYMPTKMVLNFVGHTIDTLETGIKATSRLAHDPTLATVTGAYFSIDHPAKADPQAYDPTARTNLHHLTEQLLGEPLYP
ncbi:SDR family NAD(P)-dependent oxidoreductase [Kribbella monticola]|uniref:SDR family NAD(P)-dependent oxidoreductase n=1 Tax=Kribbella monticola TaxID=2185285 RepID=UPI000DD47A6A|nr:SDR family NAD(P)-dependent oxidoreductase [Kribbella monticola]